MPQISVIVPVYNVEKYLHQCVDSILAQTFTDFELILVDDGSPDNSGAICDEYAKKDSRVMVIHQPNKGQSAARNRAIEVSRGEWIHFVDSDDLIHSQMLEILYSAVIENDANISMCSAYESIDIPNDFFKLNDIKYDRLNLTETVLMNFYDNIKFKSWVVWGKLIKKEICEKIPFTEGRIFEDNAVVCKWLIEANTIVDIDAKLYFYRINQYSTTKSEFNIKKLDYLWALEEIYSYFYSINYLKLANRFLLSYLSNSANYYYRVKSELKSSSICHNIKKNMRNVYKKHKKTIFHTGYVTINDKINYYSIISPTKAFIYRIKRKIKTVINNDT